MQNETFLITGATGFIGSNIARFLVKEKKRVAIIARSELHWELKDIADKLEVYTCDLLSPSLEEVVKKINPTYIFHLAAYGSLPQQDNLAMMLDVNIKGTINLINAVKKTKFSLFINTGSSSEYGIKEKPMKETDFVEPINDYSVTKLAQTLFCAEIAKRESLPIITLRLFSPYGYFEKKSRLIPTVILNALKGNSLQLASPNNVRDFIFIEDVIQAYMQAIYLQFNPGEIINIGSGIQHRVGDVVNTVFKVINFDTNSVSWNSERKQARQIEPKAWVADIAKAINILNWKPKYTLEEGIIQSVNWFKKHLYLYG